MLCYAMHACCASCVNSPNKPSGYKKYEQSGAMKFPKSTVYALISPVLCPERGRIHLASLSLEKTLTTPSPPPLTTHRPSWLQTTLQTPSPRMSLWLVISCEQERFSRDQKRRLASWPADTSSAPEGEREREEMAEGWASML